MSQARGSDATQFRAFKEQDRFLWADKRYFGYISGVGAGKTFAGILRTYLNMEKWNVDEMGAIIAPTRQMIVNVVIPEMRDMGLVGEGCPWTYKSAYSDEPGIHADNGSRALVLSADNQRAIERLRGLNLSWAWIDEEAVVNPRAREIAIQRLRTGEYRNYYATTTPKGKNHTYDFFVADKSAEQSQYGEATLYESDDRVAIVGVPTSANPHTPEDYKDAMESDLPEELRAQEVQGQFVEIGSGVFSLEMLDFVGADALREDKEYRYVIGVDVGVQADTAKAESQDSDYWAAALLMVSPTDKTAHCVDIQRERGLSLKQGVEWLQSIVAPIRAMNPELHVESNQAQRWLRQELSDAGLNARAVQNTTNKEERLIQLSLPLERGDIKFVNQRMDDSLGYDSRFRPVVDEMLSFPEGSHDDCLDALEIAVNSVDFGGANILSADPYGRGE